MKIALSTPSHGAGVAMELSIFYAPGSSKSMIAIRQSINVSGMAVGVGTWQYSFNLSGGCRVYTKTNAGYKLDAMNRFWQHKYKFYCYIT